MDIEVNIKFDTCASGSTVSDALISLAKRVSSLSFVPGDFFHMISHAECVASESEGFAEAKDK